MTTDVDSLVVWRQLWLPLLSSFGRQSTNASREIRHSSISQLQRTLLGPYEIFKDCSEDQREEIFNRIVFPLLDELLKPQVFARDPAGMPESRLRASALLCKTFMHFEVRESANQADIRVLWIQILDLLDRLMNADRRDQLVRRCQSMVQTESLSIAIVRSNTRVSQECYTRHAGYADAGSSVK